MTEIILPWPPADLSGHNTGHWRSKSPIVAKHRLWAFTATKAARPFVPVAGDIGISVTFYPPDNRSDRINYWNRCKPYFDGIAEAMGVNDARFVPTGYYIGVNTPNGAVHIAIHSSHAGPIA